MIEYGATVVTILLVLLVLALVLTPFLALVKQRQKGKFYIAIEEDFGNGDVWWHSWDDNGRVCSGHASKKNWKKSATECTERELARRSIDEQLDGIFNKLESVK